MVTGLCGGVGYYPNGGQKAKSKEGAREKI
jgi:hypothetical protein